MTFRNPNVPWSELERRLSDDPLGRGPWIEPTPGDGGDSPAWSRKRLAYEPPPAAGGASPAGWRKRRPYEPQPDDRPGLGPGGGSEPYAELHCHTNFSFLD